MRVMGKVARYVARDLTRSRWLLAYTGFFVASTSLLLRFGEAPEKALVSLSSVVLFVVPLANVVFGAMYVYASREFIELLLAQPLRRRALFGGLLAGLSLPVAGASALGLLVPLALHRVAGAALLTGVVLAACAAALSIVFTAIAVAMAFAIEDRVRGLAAAIGVWLLLAIVYDAVVLLAASQLADYPLERPMLVAMLANPIDLSRLVLLVRLDGAALLGYTGAVFQQFFGGAGVLVAALAVALWAVVPALAGARLFHRKDF